MRKLKKKLQKVQDQVWYNQMKHQEMRNNVLLHSDLNDAARILGGFEFTEGKRRVKYKFYQDWLTQHQKRAYYDVKNLKDSKSSMDQSEKE